MTINELIEVLKKFDGNLEVINAVPATAFDCDALSCDISLEVIHEDSFELDTKHNIVILKTADSMPDLSDWRRCYPWLYK